VCLRFGVIVITSLTVLLFLTAPVQIALGESAIGAGFSQPQASQPAAESPFGLNTSPGKVVAPAAYNWPQFGGFANHTASVVSPSPLTNHLVRFVNLTEPGSVVATPALYNDMLFLARGGIFHALNASTMTYNATISQGWNFTTGNRVSIDSSPAVGGGSVFFGATNGVVYAFSAVLSTCPVGNPSCHLEWTYQTGGPVLSSPTYDNGMVFVGSNDGSLYALSATSGALLWKFTTNKAVESSPAVANSEVVFGSNNGNVYFLDESNGNEVQMYGTKGPVESSPAISGGIAYFGSNDSNVYAVSMTSGTTVWKYATGGPVVASPAVAGGYVYVGSTDGYFYALKALHNKNQLAWRTFLGPVVAPAALANGVISNLIPTFLPVAYVSSTSGELYTIVRSTGELN